VWDRLPGVSTPRLLTIALPGRKIPGPPALANAGRRVAAEDVSVVAFVTDHGTRYWQTCLALGPYHGRHNVRERKPLHRRAIRPGGTTANSRGWKPPDGKAARASHSLFEYKPRRGGTARRWRLSGATAPRTIIQLPPLRGFGKKKEIVACGSVTGGFHPRLLTIALPGR
jgi:hypothetical protein